MLKVVGFRKVEVVSSSFISFRMGSRRGTLPAYYFVRVARAVVLKLLRNEAFFYNLNCGRMVFHAWK